MDIAATHESARAAEQHARPPVTTSDRQSPKPKSVNPSRQSTGYDTAFFVALLFTALALGPALAHLLSLPNKIAMGATEYFIAQVAYQGWNRLALVLLIQLAGILVTLLLSRHEPRVFWPTAGALVCLVAAQMIFWLYTYPANAATGNWTVVTDNWPALRQQWEYSHAVGAAFQISAMAALIWAALARARRSTS